MLRLRPPGQERLLQSPSFEASFGGSEADAAVSMAAFGLDVGVLTILPNHPIGDACAAELRKFGVDVSRILRREGRMGIYFTESGASQLPASVIYDREGSLMACAGPGDVDWARALRGVEWFHVTGITPAISESAMKLTLEGIAQAGKRGITVSCDYNYRTNLWRYGKKAEDILRQMSGGIHVLFASEFDLMRTFDLPRPNSKDPAERCRVLGDAAMERCSNLRMVAGTMRETHGATHHQWSACLNDGTNFYRSRRYDIPCIVDRFGAGDAFAGGLLYGLEHYQDKGQALEFAAAAACLKHSVPGDFNRVRVSEVESLMSGGPGARVLR